MFSWIIFITISVLAVAFLSGRFTAEYAAEKGRSKRAWFFRGGLFTACSEVVVADSAPWTAVPGGR